MNSLARYSLDQLRSMLADSVAACACFEPLSEEFGDAAEDVRAIRDEIERRK